MNIHELIDRFGTQTPRARLLGYVAALAVIGAILLGVFYAGVRSAHQWADSKYLQESAKRDKLIAEYEASAAIHEKNESQLAAQNALLKKQNEATAEILGQRDKAIAAASAKKFTDLANERNKQYENIDADGNYDSQLCGLCADAARSGHKLSDSICGRCKGNP